jgi:hypothetical protein
MQMDITLQAVRSWVSFRSYYRPGVDSAPKRNGYQENFLGVKAAGAYGRQSYHFHVPTVLISVSLSVLELSGFVQPSTGIALPFQ